MVTLKPNLYLRSRRKISHRVEISKRVQTYSCSTSGCLCVILLGMIFRCEMCVIQYFSFDTLLIFSRCTIMYTNIYRRLNVTDINR